LAASAGPDLTGDTQWLGALNAVGGYLGWGYGRVTSAGESAIRRFADGDGPKLDTTYSAKAAAGLLDILPGVDGPALFWSTKSSAPMPAVNSARLAALPAAARRWLQRGGVNWEALPAPSED